MLILLLFILLFALLLMGYPVAFTLAGVSILFGAMVFGFDFFHLLPLRIYGIMQNFVLLAVPLFIFMGVTLEKSGIAGRLLNTTAILFGRFKGGLALAVILVGTLLAASTGIVGATVVTMGLISLPTMLKRNYHPSLASGVVASSGTLGQIIPPSILLVLLGSVMNIPVGELFVAAIIPGLILVVAYSLWVISIAKLKPSYAPTVSKEEWLNFKKENFWFKIIKSFALPIILIFVVLGSIFAGVASPTEAAGIGAVLSLILTGFERKLSTKVLKEISKETIHITSMVFMILVGATALGLVFRGLGGDQLIIQLIEKTELSPVSFLLLIMLIMFVAGFFIDFIEIIFIFMPVVTPVLIEYNIDLLWVAILISINLQTSFLTPPFGFSLFYLKGVAPKSITTNHIYKGIIPFIIIQIAVLGIVFCIPETTKWLISVLKT